MNVTVIEYYENSKPLSPGLSSCSSMHITGLHVGLLPAVLCRPQVHTVGLCCPSVCLSSCVSNSVSLSVSFCVEH